MKLLVVSHTPHYREASGRLVGWGATVRELDRLATLFEKIIHLAPVHGPATEPPSSSLPYAATNVEVRALRPVGGDGLGAKLGILAHAPTVYARLWRAYGEVDAVHVRAPANVALLTLVAWTPCRPRKPCWVKYAGNWHVEEEHADPADDPRSYRLQRRLLRAPRPRTVVTVNGRRPDDGAHVHSFYNPCLSAEELRAAREAAERKRLDGPLRLLFVGRLDEAKGAGRAVRVVAALARDGVDARLVVAGDGPERASVTALASDLGIENRVSFRGWLSRDRLDECYAEAHALLLPTRASEGWPKVFSEAMAHGALVLSGRVSCVPQWLDEWSEDDERVGWALDADDAEGFARRAAELLGSEELFRARSRRACRAAEAFTYERYLDRVRELMRGPLGLDI